MSSIPPLGTSPYTLELRLPDTPYEQAVTKVVEALKGEGFGVLTEIDVKATLKKKLDEDVRPYIILGACNPPLAHQAMSAEPNIGALLPCNVVVAAHDEGGSSIAAIDPIAMFSVIGRPELEPVAGEVKGRLERVLAAVGGAA